MSVFVAYLVSRKQFLLSLFLARLEILILFLAYVHFLATVTATLLCAELVFCDSALAHGTGFLSRALLPIGLAGVINIPIHFWIRSFGIRKFHFREHEAYLDATHLLPAESCFRNASLHLYDEMAALIRAIDSADVWERQAARCNAKAWVQANRTRLDKTAWDFLRERVGYLLPDEPAPSQAR